MLEVRSLSAAYGHHCALDGVSIDAAPGEIVVILGANGAGKTTLLKAIGGLVPAAPGSSITIAGMALGGVKTHRIVEAGIALVPEGRGVFGELTVEENLRLGAFARRAREREPDNCRRVLELFSRLGERMKQRVRTMSGGEQQMVAIGRALMSDPDILMLDEPSLGLSPLLTSEVFRILTVIRDGGVGVLLVEQNARRSLEIGDRAYLLETGRIVGSGTAAELLDDPRVREAYLGVGGQGP